jgi:hypothetical protein
MAAPDTSIPISSMKTYGGSKLSDAAWGTLTKFGTQAATADAWTRGGRPASKNFKITRIEFVPEQSIQERQETLALKLRDILMERSKLANELAIEDLRKFLAVLDKVACVAFFLLPIGGAIVNLVKGAARAAAERVLEMVFEMAMTGDLPGAGDLVDNLGGLGAEKALDKWLSPLAKKGIQRLQIGTVGEVYSLSFGNSVATQLLSFSLDGVIKHAFGNRNPFEDLLYRYSAQPHPSFVMAPMSAPFQPVPTTAPNDNYKKYRAFIDLGAEYDNVKLEFAEAYAFRYSVDPIFAQKELVQAAYWANIGSRYKVRTAPPSLDVTIVKPGSTVTILNYYTWPDFLWLCPPKGNPVSLKVTAVTNSGLVFTVPPLTPDGSYTLATGKMLAKPSKLECGSLTVVKALSGKVVPPK